jgi:kynurenine formamidase
LVINLPLHPFVMPAKSGVSTPFPVKIKGVDGAPARLCENSIVAK